jgi:RHS repeat-associated protein
VVADPTGRSKVFTWRLTKTEDPFGNRIVYEYERDLGEDGFRRWDQLYLKRVRYADYSEQNETKYLVSVTFEYEERPEPFSDYRAGFEIRTRKRCQSIKIRIHAGEERLVRSYQLIYMDQVPGEEHFVPRNGVSLLRRIRVVGHDGDDTEELPPLEFGYTAFEPEKRRYLPFSGVSDQVPDRSLAHPEYELADLFGNGLPSVVQINGQTSYWRNLGGGNLDVPRTMKSAPAGASLADPGVQMADMNGDGRADLLVIDGARGGYYPLTFRGEWDKRGYAPYQRVPTVGLEDPDTKLMDLDGDGVVDALRTGASLELYHNDGNDGWDRVELRPRKHDLAEFPDVSFADPRVKLADMTGDGLQDIVLVYDGRVDYWPYLGHGQWGKRITMRNAPRFEDRGLYAGAGYDPKRLLIGDVDGDGCADLVYVGSGRMTVWINRCGNGFGEPVVIRGTPPITDADAVRLADMQGTGTSGILWTYDYGTQRDSTYKFLDLTGGVKPYLLNQMNNCMGALTCVEYAPSTRFYLEDQKRKTPWKTPLPFPVQVVSRVEIIDEISKGKLTTEYRYHHGYWDGFERELRGFGMVEQLDTERFEDYNRPGLHGDHADFVGFGGDRARHFAPPTLTKTWFHQGAADEGFGEWRELEGFEDEFWGGDPQRLPDFFAGRDLLGNLEGHARRDALRALRGRILRMEVYARDGTGRENRPYTVTEYLYGVRQESAPASDRPCHRGVFFGHELAQRTTQWERGDDPMTRFGFTEDHDEYGQPRKQTQIACPRSWTDVDASLSKDHLATHSEMTFAQRDVDGRYIVDRTATTTDHEIGIDRETTVAQLREAIIDGSAPRRVIGQTLNFYDGEPFTGLPSGEVGEHGALMRTETLVLNEAILQQAYGDDDIPPYLASDGSPAWTPEYPQSFRDGLPIEDPSDPTRPSLTVTPVGYGFAKGDRPLPFERGYFAATERRRYDFHDDLEGRGLVTVRRDSLGHDATIAYDKPYRLLQSEVTDPVGLKTTAGYDYRVLQPREVTDPNNNHTRFGFTPLGLLKDTWVLGKPANAEGDKNRPSVSIEYDFLAFADRGQPISVRSICQVHHDTETDVPLPQRDETITGVEYSDGFGRLLQTRTQAENVVFGEDLNFGNQVLPAAQTDPGGDAVGHVVTDPANKPRVVVSGWQTYDNKGRVVEKYEPFFSEGWEYRPPIDAQLGQRATIFYDPRGQMIRTLHPDGSEQRVIYGVPTDLRNPDVFTPTPWETYTYDANDNSGRTHPAASTSYQNHRNTPVGTTVDALGRTVETVERNGPNPATDWYVSRSAYDIRGNLISVTDPLKRVVFEYVYSLTNRPLRVESIDAGIRRSVLDAVGNVVETRDSKGALLLRAVDVLNRPIRMWARDGTGQPLTLRERLVYGDSTDAGLTTVQAAAKNILGKPYQHYDEAGLLAFETYDFKGNVRERSRQVIGDNAILTVFKPSPPKWQVKALRADWQPPQGMTLEAYANGLLDLTVYRTSLTYDALNRVRTMLYPQDVGVTRQELRPRYNRAGALESVELDGKTCVERIAYNAKGQRTLVAYGNGVMTRNAYDPQTFCLMRMRTERYTKPNALTYHPTGAPLQDFAYAYDLANYLLTLSDRTPGSGVATKPNALDRAFTYDPLYRLLSATGRECDAPPPPLWNVGPRCADITKTRTCTETYEYDPVDNLKRLQHQAPSGAFTRVLALTPNSNRLATVTVGAKSHAYAYDASGNLIREDASRHFEWDHADRMRVYRTQIGESEPTVHVHYLYDAGGQRVKKLVRKSSQVEVTVYVDGVFEHHRVIKARATQENNTLHVMDDQSRIMQVRVGKPFADDTTPAVKYHLADHLNSSNVVVDDTGSWVNREEYTPYGETSFGSFARKRYRFTGKERDEESGLYYHGARYYAPWVGRWLSCDKGKTVPGTSLYRYASNTPQVMIDPDGEEDVIVVGTQMHPDQQGAGNKLNFMHQAIKETKQSKIATILLFGEGYTDLQKEKFRAAIESNKGTVKEVTSAEEVVNYLNSKSLDKAALSTARSNDQVSKLAVFAHGRPKVIAFGLGTKHEEAQQFGISHAQRLDPKAFAPKLDATSFACRTGLGNPDIDKKKWPGQSEKTKESLAQAIADQIQQSVKAFKSRSDYEDTLGTSDDRGVDLPLVGRQGSSPELDESLKRRQNLDGATFDPEGALRPVKGGTTPENVNNNLTTFKPRPKVAPKGGQP